MSSRWSGKVALITGGTSGIGLAVTRMLLKSGLRCAVAARNLERLGQRARVLLNEPDLAAQGRPQSDRLLCVGADVAREAEVLALFQQIRERFGGIDVLINNAGLGYQAPLVNGSAEQWREMLDVNVLGLCLCTREAVRDMRRRGAEGHIVHVSSLAAHRVTAGAGVYGATKAAVRSLTESLRRELHELELPIRVSAISPGYVETEFHQRFYASEARARALYREVPSLDADDVAAAVHYALESPAHVQVHDILLRNAGQPL